MKHSILVLAAIFIALASFAQNLSEWRGPSRTGIYNETGLLKNWTEKAPEVVWTFEGLGEGYSSVTLANNTIYTTAKKGNEDVVIALTMDGKEKWRTAFGASWDKSFNHSRTSPTVEGESLYVVSGLGHVACINASTGAINWKLDAYTKFEGDCGTWGVCESPLIIGDKLIYTPGGNKTTMVALNKTTGEVIWQSESLKDKTGYVSPIVIEWAGKKVIVSNIATYIFGVDAENGKILWKFNYKEADPENKGSGINTNTPLYRNGEIFVSSGYNHTGVMLKLAADGNSVEMKWKNNALDVHHGGVVELNGFIYGSNWLNNGNGNWLCLNWETGEIVYENEWGNKGAIISADGMLYCYDEKEGEIALVEANAKDFAMKGTLKIEKGDGPHWAHPVINNGNLYVRHGNALTVYRIK